MSRRVLVVDDEEAIVDGLTTLLGLEDIESAGALDRLSAEAMLHGTFYPVVVADLRLHAEEEGLMLLDGIRRISPRTRVITLTGFSTPEMDEEVLRRGSMRIIKKPAEMDVILAAISELLAEVERLAAEQETPDFEELHLGLRRLLHSIPRRKYGLSAEEAEDVVQEAWLLFLEKQRMVRAARPWLAGTVVNLSRRQAERSRNRREQLAEADALECVEDVRSEAPDDAIALRTALASLDATSRRLCTLIAIDGHSYVEASALTGLPLGSIGPMYMRAKATMRRRLAK
jgi:RNA polymerase sigma factor (sigma-70 family)